ncbi:MAG: amidohydrolase, partial [Cytophagales bacterium]|nr:amidohydrolase [Cytophagales bacterium]
NKRGPFSWNQAIRSEVQAVGMYKYNDAKANEWRRAGFGTVLSHVRDGIARGTSTLCLLSDGKDTDMSLEPEAGAHFSFSKGSSAQEYPSSLMGAIALLRQTFYDAQWYDNHPQQEVNLSLQALNKQKKMPLFFETSNKLSILRAAKIGKEFGLQFIIKGNGDEYQLLNEIKETKSKLIVPLNFPKPYDVEDPFVSKQLTWSQLKHWEMASLNPGFLEKSQVDFALTMADLTDKKEFLRNLRLAVKNGLSESTALKALTFFPASLVRQEGKIGRLAPGYLANFIITSGNFFEDGTVIYENWVRGKKHAVLPRPLFDPRGKYALKIGQFPEWKLVVKGKKENPEVVVSESDSVTHKATFSVNGNSVSLSIVLKKDSLVRDLRLTGNYTQAVFEGFGAGDDGKLFPWKAVYKDTVLTPQVQPTKMGDSSLLQSKIKYPFVGFGFDKMPVQESVLIKNATVYTGTEPPVLVNTDVLLVGGKIKQIGQGLPSLGVKTI